MAQTRSPDMAEGVGPNEYSVSMLAEEFGLNPRTLRFYEDRGLVLPRRRGGGRIYSEDDRSRLALIMKGKQLGFTLSEIASMLGKADTAAGRLRLTRPQIDSQIRYLEKQISDMMDALAELRAARASLGEAMGA